MCGISPGCVAGEVRRDDGDFGAWFTDSFDLVKEGGEIWNMLNDVIHPDFGHAIVVEGKWFAQISGNIDGFAGVKIDSDEIVFALISTAEIKFHW